MEYTTKYRYGTFTGRAPIDKYEQKRIVDGWKVKREEEIKEFEISHIIIGIILTLILIQISWVFLPIVFIGFIRTHKLKVTYEK